MSAKKEFRKLLREAERQGWRVEVRSSGHFMLFAPDGEGIVTVAGTPSDTNALTITIGRMRRYGFKWEGR